VHTADRGRLDEVRSLLSLFKSKYRLEVTMNRGEQLRVKYISGDVFPMKVNLSNKIQVFSP
jgi:hypothetical protein